MAKKYIIFVFIISVLGIFKAASASTFAKNPDNQPIITGAEQLDKYLPLLKNKRVGMVVNQTSIIGHTLSVDSLQSLGIQIKLIFGPEHGFRGSASNGAKVGDEIDLKTGIPIISLYGKKRLPSIQDMDKIDVMVFDIQDVGCRFYTYIYTLANVMEACAMYHKDLIILDRPNPNAYIDGPVLDMQFKSGIGKFPIPITYGLTIAELAKMINGEKWLPNNLQCPIKIIPLKNYTHKTYYTLPVSPSPNLNSQASIILYPSLCLFEGTIISQGRGTQEPFTILGAPKLKGEYKFQFTPRSIKGMSERPLHQDTVCYGIDLKNINLEAFHSNRHINLKWMIELYKAYPEKNRFFDWTQSNQIGRITHLVGDKDFENEITSGWSERRIRHSWKPGIKKFKVLRKKYLLYP